MNIFDDYLEKIKKTLIDLSKEDKIVLPDNLNGINTEIPPSKFNCDISSNAAMFLSKINKKSPLEIAEEISTAIKKNDKTIETITIAKPGFINIKFNPIFWTNFIKTINKNSSKKI